MARPPVAKFVNQKIGSKIMPIRGGVGKTESGTRGPMNHHHETESGSHVDLMRHSRSLIFVLMRHSRKGDSAAWVS